ncbi:DUF11 domain-containing protein [Deinococcus alpinitundrae]|uniref:DUF11 domain-containing protein n=1 Tax=Deinococcus alpinitundrae TaxID=468913 RepID=UPI00137B2580|nr:DUF11 domain-containing protein [Deinococcus alpinitundrae]
MNLPPKTLALMLALAASAASAAGTPSGTKISNVATASFTDPNTNAPISDPVQSNLVQTSVLPKPDFDTVYSDGTDGTTATTPSAPDYDIKNVLPGANVDTSYILVNLGNVNNQPITIAPNTTGTVTPVPAGSVEYYLGSVSPANLITGSIPVPVDDPLTPTDEGRVTIIQRIKVPTGAAAGSQYSVSPQASGDQWNGSAVVPAQEPAGDLQYTRASVTSPSVTVVPPIDTVPGTPAPEPTTPGTTPGDPDPANPVPVYPDPTTPGTTISVDPTTGSQKAYPKGDLDTTSDVVKFISAVKNNGSLPDTVALIPPTGLPTGVTVQILDGSGNPITKDANGNYPLGPIPVGGSAAYQVVVTYPDPDGVGNSGSPVPVVIGVDSSNDADLLPNSSATFTTFPAQQVFGDTVNPGGTADAGQVPSQGVVPGASTGTGNSATDSSATFPMTVQNTGGYAEAYTLTGSVDVKLVNGTTVPVPVKYYLDANNDGVPDSATPLTGGLTLSVPSGGSVHVIAVVDIPANAASTTANGGSAPLIVKQTSVGTYSGNTRSDNNDQIVVGIVGNGLSITKSTPPAARPGDDLPYTLVATNNYNAALKNFVLTEKGGVTQGATTTNLFTYSTFKTVTGTASFVGKVLYRFNNAAWQTSAVPGLVPSTINQVDVGVDTNNDNTIDSNDAVPSGGVLTVNFTTTVK